jgi:heme exporter protein D
MYFDSLQAALNMDGHGMYVWPAYAVSTLVIVLLLLAPLRRRKRTLAQLAGEAKRNQGARADRVVGAP